MRGRHVEPELAERPVLSQILARALRERRLVITDFGDLVYRRGLAHTGVLLPRLEDATGEEKRAVVRAIFEQYGEALPGRFTVYQDGRLRMRPALQS